MDRHISGTGSAPIDLPTLIATDFIYYEVLAFQMKDTVLHDLDDSNPKFLYADDTIRTLKTKFRSIKAQGLCNSSESKKLCMEGCLARLKLSMNNQV